MNFRCFLWKKELYTWSKPAKYLFNSTLVYDVVTRGDIFATRLNDNVLVIIPGGEPIEPVGFELIYQSQLFGK